MNIVNVVGDIAGNFKTLMALIEKMPKGKLLAVGDLVDRGPRSKEVLDYFMTADDVEALHGNHENMMLDHFRPQKKGYDGKSFHLYGNGIWEMNGGSTTLSSFAGGPVPDKYLDFLASLRTHKELAFGDDTYLVSHAFLPEGKTIEQAQVENCRDLDASIIWNRWGPVRLDKYKMQICGHNSQMGHKTFSDERGPYGVCIDTSRHNVLTGLSLPSMTIFQQEYID